MHQTLLSPVLVHQGCLQILFILPIQNPLLLNNLPTTWKYLPPWRVVSLILFCLIYATPNGISGVEIGIIGNRMQPIIFAISVHNVNNGRKKKKKKYISTPSLSPMNDNFLKFLWDLFYWLKKIKKKKKRRVEECILYTETCVGTVTTSLK